MMKRAALLSLLLLAACTSVPAGTQTSSSSSGTIMTGSGAADTGSVLGASVQYQAPKVTLDPGIAQPFTLDEVKNLAAMEKAYGFTLSAAEKASLEKNKFLVKNLLSTSIRPDSGGDAPREMVELYGKVTGPYDYKARGQENSIFFSSDVFFNTYNNLFTELLKEAENTVFEPSMQRLSKTFYDAASAKLSSATSQQDKDKWMKVRNYFAVPYALLSNTVQPLTTQSYMDSSGGMADPQAVEAQHSEADAKADTLDTATSFVKNLKLDSESEKAVLADLQTIFSASGKGVPQVFAQAYKDYDAQEDMEFMVDFSQFTPRGTYTTSSIRRQYFRAMNWFTQVPFFVKSPALTTYAFAITQLMAENPAQLSDYDKLEKTINFLIGQSDDLMPSDYMQALESAKGRSDQNAAVMEYLAKARNPHIKSLAAYYPTVGEVQSDDVLLKTKGMRFFSGKFVIDSAWTGYLTQGDEAPRPGYSQKLPPMASSLEVMTLLGSQYAKTQIPTLDFYTANYSQAIDQAMNELTQQESVIGDAFWQSTIYNGWLWTIKSLFSWQASNKQSLPAFMQSPLWEVKTLQTASAFWTELRHASILYAKQSFAELGAGGPDDCDPRQVPPPPKAYIEPQAEAYARLEFLAKRTDQGLKDAGFGSLANLDSLENFISLMDTVQGYTQKELANTTLHEATIDKTRPDPNDPKKMCTEHFIDGDSDWETLRLQIVSGLNASEPMPVDGPILPASARRAALVADVHTGGDSDNPTRILYEGEGVPLVILTAVKDGNGPRLTIGFVYSHYEFTQPYGGQRMTDEDWQKNFYNGSDPYSAYDYTKQNTWPAVTPWYQSLFPVK